MWTKAMFSNETIKEIAKAHDKSPAQIILRWDISVFDFELSDEEMARINALDRGEKHDWY